MRSSAAVAPKSARNYSSRPRRSPLVLDARPSIDPADEIVRHIESVTQEVDSLRAELNVLRRRDETLNFYMHRLDEELRLAARLQQDFLPKNLPQLGSVHFHTLFRPAGYVSGDLYDVIRLDERRIGFYIADAVGHGMPAALLTMFIKHALVTKEIAGNQYRLLSPAESLCKLNAELIEQNLSQATFATALYGIIDVQTLEITLARAGHPNPMILRGDGSIDTIECDGPLLGIFPDEQFTTVSAKLSPGDRLLLYTDGIEVAFCEDQGVDCERWKQELISHRDLPTETLLNQFSDRLDMETGSLAPKDDLTMIVLEVK